MRKIVVLGNSVGLRVRPPAANRELNVPYSVLIEREIQSLGLETEVHNKCHGRYLIEQVLKEVDLHIREYPEIYIINAGVTDACTREIPLWFSNVLHGNRTSPVRLACLFIYKYLITKFRRQFVFLRGKRPWRSMTVTKYGFSTLLKDLTKNTSAKIFMLGVMEVDSRVESMLPGSNKNIKILNSYLYELCKKYDENVVFIDLSSIEKCMQPDGIHLNVEGHKKLKDMIVSNMELNEP